ncbi:MAG: hypothetical protein ACM3JK_06910, partial [Betaproteobacteria bacterium]
QLDLKQLSDQQTSNLNQRIEEKLKSGADVIKAPEEPAPAETASNVIDLMQVLKERLQGRQPPASRPGGSPNRGKPTRR